MHICFITHEYPKPGFPHGGLGSFVKTMAEALVIKGIQVSVVGLNYSRSNETEAVNGVDVIRIKKSMIKGLAWYFNSKAIANTLSDLHKKNPIAIVEGAELSLAFLPKIKGIKYIIRLHGGHHFFAEAENRGIDWWKGFQEQRSFTKADAFIAVSDYVKTHTENYLSYHNKPLVYINNPINTDVFRPLERELIQHKIVFAGTVCEKKGARQLIKAFLLVKMAFPDATLHLYGRDWFYPDSSSYIAMLKEKELPLLGAAAQSVFFHGAVALETIAQKYAEAEVCVFPSHMETLGLVAPEAMAMGKPVVFTDKGPGPEIVTDGVTGLLCDPLDAEDIATKILWVFRHRTEAEIMGKKAESESRERFSVEKLVHKNIDFYTSLI